MLLVSRIRSNARARLVCVYSPCAWHRPNTCRPIDKEDSRGFACRGSESAFRSAVTRALRARVCRWSNKGRSRLKRQADFGRLVAILSEVEDEPSRNYSRVLRALFLRSVMFRCFVARGAQAPYFILVCNL